MLLNGTPNNKKNVIFSQVIRQISLDDMVRSNSVFRT